MNQIPAQAQVDAFCAFLKTPQITAAQAQQISTALHAATVDLPEFQWMSTTFEDMADGIASAIFCAAAADPAPDDSWIARQDEAVAVMA